MKSQSESYKEAGVDITSGYRAVELMKEHVAKTMVFGNTAPVGGLFQPDLTGMEEPVLVSGTDGVGTKLKLAFLQDRHDTVGIDCVAMCVNDILCVGANPLFFLDYIACGKNVPEKIADIVKGVADGCVQSECSLIGGETAEMPGFYPEDEYDLAGFAVGIVDKKKVIDRNSVKEGDVIIGIASSGIHSNGYSLVRKVFDVENQDLTVKPEELGGKTLGEVLLTPTKIYVKPMLALFKEIQPHGVMHITGGGFYENIPRGLPEGFSAKISKDSLEVPAIFKMLMEKGGIPERDMFNTYNMGTGMTVVVDEKDADRAIEIINGAGEKAKAIGRIVKGGEGVIITGLDE